MELFEFYRIASRLKRTKRVGWARRIVGEDVESVADHSLMTAILSMIIASDRGLDAHRCAALAVVHDLAESIVGDLPPDELPAERKHAMEREAMDELTDVLEDGDILSRLYREYEEGGTEEARLVHNVDKLEMGLQALSYYLEGKLRGDEACEFVEGALRYISDGEIAEHLLDAARRYGLKCPNLGNA